MEDRINGATAIAEVQPHSETKFGKKTKRPESGVVTEPEQIRMGSVTIQVPLKLLKLAELYREDCGNIRGGKAEAKALTAAQEAYSTTLNKAFEGDEDFQLSLLERESKKAKA